MAKSMCTHAAAPRAPQLTAKIPPPLLMAQQAFRLANEALLVTDGDTKVLFDPLDLESYGPYQLI